MTSSCDESDKTSVDPSGNGKIRVEGEFSPVESLISPSVSFDSISTIGSVIVRQNTAGIASTAKTLWNQVLERNPWMVGKSVK
jgi:hypothetical protein